MRKYKHTIIILLIVIATAILCLSFLCFMVHHYILASVALVCIFGVFFIEREV